MSGGLRISIHPGEGMSRRSGYVRGVLTPSAWVGMSRGRVLTPDTWDLGYYVILMTSGRYSSYWNTFLNNFAIYQGKLKRILSYDT